MEAEKLHDFDIKQRDLLKALQLDDSRLGRNNAKKGLGRTSKQVDNVYYHFHAAEQLRNVLFSTDCIQSYNVIKDIVNIIISFVGTLDWSAIDKSDNIGVINSSDKKISYAILQRLRQNPWNNKRYDNIFLNQWTNIDLVQIIVMMQIVFFRLDLYYLNL